MDYEQQIRRHNFGEALANLKKGMAVSRRGWHLKGMYLKLQVPDEHSKMTLPYIYLTLPWNPGKHDRQLVPWLASQTDLLSDDWYVVCPE